jgi:polyisoprenoid-binding protein YceI
MSTTDTPGNAVTTAQRAREAAGARGSTTWRIDPATARAAFTIRKRLMFVRRLTITGHFTVISGIITLDERDLSTARAEITIDAASIDTQDARRDAHLRTADFFDVAAHPHLTFASRRVEAIDRGRGTCRVVGDLTVRGVTRPVTLDAHFSPLVAGASEPHIRLALTAPLNRRDFGIVWNKAAISVADELTVTIDVEATRTSS